MSMDVTGRSMLININAAIILTSVGSINYCMPCIFCRKKYKKEKTICTKLPVADSA